MVSDTTMGSSGKRLRTGIRLRCLTTGSQRGTPGKSNARMLPTLSASSVGSLRAAVAPESLSGTAVSRLLPWPTIPRSPALTPTTRTVSVCGAPAPQTNSIFKSSTMQSMISPSWRGRELSILPVCSTLTTPSGRARN
jgi:hypothetical protein